MPDEDFVAIRLASEDFAAFRETFGRALSRTRKGIDGGQLLAVAFESSLDEVRYKAEELRSGVKDKALAPFLRKTLQSAAVGALVGTSAAAAADGVRGALSPEALSARGTTTFLLSTLLALLFYRPPAREARLLRFYNVLLGN